MELTVRQMLGQKLVFGFHGTVLPEEFKNLLREYKIGNVILFLRNVESAAQVRRLCAEIQRLIWEETGLPAFIMIDQEGGMVSRLPETAVNVPGAMAVAATGKPENARLASEITIRQLRGLGVNFNLAPVMDVNSNPQNPVIGNRSYGDEAEKVAAFGAAAIAPYTQSGVLCCAKHFPGHGDTAVDSHLGLPRVDKTAEELEQLELIPFRAAMAAGVSAVMMSHVMFPNIEPERVPCTMSRRMVTGLLKERLGFRGLILTDCMQMGAIQDFFGTAAGTVASIKAGVDLAEISSSAELEREAAEAVMRAAEAGEFDMDEIRESVRKILRFKERLLTEPAPECCNLESDRQAVGAMMRQAVSCVGGSAFTADENTFFCGCADYRASGVGNEDSDSAAFASVMSRTFGAQAMVTDKDPADAQIRQAVGAAACADKVVLATCNAHLFRGQLALARALAALGKPMAVIALRNPYDLAALPDSVWKIAAYDYSAPAFDALEEILRGGSASGVCPVRL